MAGTAAPDQQEAHLAGNDPEDSGQGLAKDAIGQGADLVMATGGDGTVMACATALHGSEVPLAVLPLGTAAPRRVGTALEGAWGVGLMWCEAVEAGQRYVGRWQTASMLLPSGSRTKAP
jgi:hypothetical protein